MVKYNKGYQLENLKCELIFGNGETFIAYNYALPDSDRIILEYSFSESDAVTSGNVLGVLTANTFNLRITGDNLELMPHNSQSPFYGYTDKPIFVNMYIKDADSDVWEPYGKYWSEGFSSSVSGANIESVSLSGSDVLQRYLNLPLPPLDAYYNVSVKDLLGDIFNKIGLGDKYVIDETLDANIRYSVLDHNKVRDTLNSICQALIARINLGRDGVVYVRPALYSSDSYEIINQEFFEGMTSEGNKGGSFDGISLEYNTYDINNKSELLLEIKDVNIPTGEHVFDTIKFKSPIFAIDYVKISYDFIFGEDIKNVSLKYTGYQSGINIVTNNTGKRSLTGTIKIYGFSMQSNIHKIESGDTGADSNVLKLRSSVIQDESSAKKYFDEINRYINLQSKVINLKTHLTPKLKNGCLIAFNLEQFSIRGVFLVVAVDIKMGQSYSNDIQLVKVGDVVEV